MALQLTLNQDWQSKGELARRISKSEKVHNEHSPKRQQEKSMSLHQKVE
jgi:hypothetical protein